ncbi:MAG: MlaD family protein [Solirubrobacteraceae bacterium]
MTRPRRNRRRRDVARAYPWLGLAALVLIIAGFATSYNANSGLPLERSYEFYVDLPDANRLVKLSQVRIGGVRVGQVMDVQGRRGSSADPRPGARVLVKITDGQEQLPVDSQVAVRPASVLGATYLDIVPGRSSTTIEPRGVLPIAQATDNVELTDLLDLFDRRTARDVQRAARSVGDGLAGRGADLGETVETTARLLPDLGVVSGRLAADETRLGPLLAAVDRTMSGLAAEEDALREGTTAAGSVFEALDRSAADVAATIDAFPVSATRVTLGLRRLRPALADLATIARELRPGARVLPTTLRHANSLLERGVPAFAALRRTAPRVTQTADDLESFSRLPHSSGAIRKLGHLSEASAPLAKDLGVAQVHCNVVGAFTETVGSAFAGNGVGKGPTILNFHLKSLGTNVTEIFQNGSPLPNLHTNYAPFMNERECEAGNEPFHHDRRVLANPSGDQPKNYLPTSVDPARTAEARRVGLLDDPPAEVGR